MKTKVLIIPENYPADENPVAGIFIKDQIKALHSSCELSVFNSNPWYRGEYEQVEGVRFYDFHLFSKRIPTIAKPVGYAWWETQTLNVAKKIPKPDIIHLHGAAMRGKWVEKLAGFWNIPFVVTEHTGPWSTISARPRIFARARQTLEKAEAVLPVSHHLMQEMMNSGVSAKHWKVFGNPVDTAFFNLRTTKLAESKNILFVGRLDKFKGALRTLKAFHYVANEIPNFKLTIAGAGEDAVSIEKYIAENNLSDRVDFINQSLTRAEMRTLFHEASYLVFPSQFESFGLVAAEAMATGLPVLITNRTGPRDFTSAITGLPVNPDSVVEIGNAMVKMAQESTLFSPVEIRSFIEGKYGMGKYAEQLLGGYRQILEARQD